MASNLDVSHLFNVKDLVVVITGGGSGLGSYAARALASNGAKAVYILGRREESLKKVADFKPEIIKPIVADVTDTKSLSAAADKIRSVEGYINALFANAGVIGPNFAQILGTKPGEPLPDVKKFQEAMLKSDPADFTNTLHVNVTAVWYTTVAFLDLLDAGNKNNSAAQQSQVLVTSSIAGFSRSIVAGLAYSASKSSVTHMSKVLATYLIPYKIRVNVIAPGMYPSEMTERMIGGENFHKQDHDGTPVFEGAKALSPDRAPAERTGSEQDFASLILFALSPGGAYMNGNVYMTDGGRISQLPATY